ncbi:MAG: chorismate synthase, partial [Christensenellales bacterium]
MGSVYGKNFKVSIFGQSHAPAIGVTIDGLPAGFEIDMEQLRAFLAQRAPGQSKLSTPRREDDAFEILSGVADGKTCGAPFAAIIRNTNVRRRDYANLIDTPRPGHADYPSTIKYGGHQDRGGSGHFSGRLTAPLCIAGGIFRQMLAREGIRIAAHVYAVAGIEDAPFNPLSPEIDRLTGAPLRVIDPEAGARMAEAIERASADGDSVGGVIECAAVGLPAGIGEHMFEGLENRIALAMFGIPAVRGIEFGTGFAAAGMKGSEHNDAYIIKDGQVATRTNHHGGILGGITSGMPVIFRIAIKPTSSIFKTQDTVRLSHGDETQLTIEGRHDPCIVPRALPVVEAACAMAIFDAYLDRKKE